MPFNDTAKRLERLYALVDQFSEGEDARRGDFDTYFDDLNDSINLAVAYLEGLIDGFVTLYLGAQTEDPDQNNEGGALVAGNHYWNNSTRKARYFTGDAWIDALDVPEFSPWVIQNVLNAPNAAQFRAALELGTASTTDATAYTPAGELIDRNANTLVTLEGDGAEYTLTPAKAITAYEAGLRFLFRVNTPNTGPVDLEVGELGMQNVLKDDTNNPASGLVELAAGDWREGEIHEAVHDGTRLVLISQPLNEINTEIAGAQSTAITTAAAAAQAGRVPDAIIERRETAGSSGGSVPASFAALEINTVAKASNDVSLDDVLHQLTFAAGTYFVQFRTKFQSTVDNQSPTAKARLYNVTQDRTEVLSMPCVMSDNNSDTAYGAGQFVVAEGDILEFQGASSNTVSNGIGAGEGEDELFTIIEIWKLS